MNFIEVIKTGEQETVDCRLKTEGGGTIVGDQLSVVSERGKGRGQWSVVSCQ